MEFSSILRPLSPDALCVLGEYADGRIVFLVLAAKDLRNVSVEITDSQVMRGQGVQSVKRVEVGDVGAGETGRAVGVVPHQFSYTVTAEGYDVPLGPYTVAMSTTEADDPTYIFQCCDADWHLPVRSTWRDAAAVQSVRAVFHIGDQVYHDLTFRSMLNFFRRRAERGEWGAYERDARRRFFDNYFASWSAPHRRTLLATRSNLMLGDDHEVTDDETWGNRLAGEPAYDFLKEQALHTYRAIQGALRMDPQTARVDYFSKMDGPVLFLLVGRMYNMKHDIDADLRAIDEAVVRHLDADPLNARRVKNLVLVSSKVLLHQRADASLDFTRIFRRLEEVRRTRLGEDVEVRIIAGDLHTGHEFVIDGPPSTPRKGRKGASIPMTVVPAISSCIPTFSKAPRLLNGGDWTLRLLRRRKANGFVTFHPRKRVVTFHTRRHITHFMRNEILIGAKVLRAMFRTPPLEREEGAGETNEHGLDGQR